MRTIDAGIFSVADAAPKSATAYTKSTAKATAKITDAALTAVPDTVRWRMTESLSPEA